MRRYLEANLALRRALFALADMRTIAAIGVLLVNDHVLKHIWPSWMTGKLSDAAWCVFAPLLLAFFLALILTPLLRDKHEKQVAWLAFGIIGIAYGLFNLSDAVHGIIVHVLSFVNGTPVAMPRDATDVIALPGLLLGWRIWQSQDTARSFLQARGLTVAALAVMASVATTSLAPQTGIRCLSQHGESLVARNSYRSTFESLDGGLTWSEIPAEKRKSYDSYTFICNKLPDRVVEDPSNPLVQYDYRQGRYIARSADGGATWVKEFNLSWANHPARKRIYEGYTPGSLASHSGLDYVQFEVSPSGAIVHATSGNAVFAMGLDGVLVRTPDGHWHWAAVGPYSFDAIGRLETLKTLWDTLPFILVLVMLCVPTALSKLMGISEVAWECLLTAWFLFLAAVTIAVAPYNDQYGIIHLVFGFSSYVLAFFIALCFFVPTVGFLAEKKGRATIPRVLWLALRTLLLFYLTYLIWTQGGIAQLWLTATFAIGLPILNTVAAIISFSRGTPIAPTPPTTE